MATMRELVVEAFLLVMLTQAALAFRWTSGIKPWAGLIGCVGDNVTFPWSYVTDNEDNVITLSWWSRKKGFIANYSSDTFMTSLSYLRQAGNAGITLSDVSREDDDTYGVIVSIEGAQEVMTQNITLTVFEPPTTADGRLRIEVYTENASLAGDGSGSRVRLECGRFFSRGWPQVSVVWKDSLGRYHPSTYFQDGVFSLQLPPFAKGGNYTCSPFAKSARCLASDSLLLLGANVLVETMATNVIQQVSVDYVTNDVGQLQDAEDSPNTTETQHHHDYSQLSHDIRKLLHRVAELETAGEGQADTERNLDTKVNQQLQTKQDRETKQEREIQGEGQADTEINLDTKVNQQLHTKQDSEIQSDDSDAYAPISSLQAEIALLKDAEEVKNKQLANILWSIEDLRVGVNDEIASLQKEMCDQNTQISGLQKQVSDQNKHISGLQKQVSEQNSQISGLQKQIANLENHTTDQNNHISSLQDQVPDHTTQIPSLQNQTTDHKMQNSSLQYQAKDQKTKLSSLQDQTNGIQNQTTAIQADVRRDFGRISSLTAQPPTASLDWASSPPDGATVLACVGQEAILEWNFTLEAGDQVKDIRWYVANDTSIEIVATFTEGNFNAIPTFSERLRHLGNGVLVLDHVTLRDKGNYSVDVNMQLASGMCASRQRSVRLEVAAPPVTAGQLVVTQGRHAVHNNVTADWRVLLRCGTFTDRGQLPVDVLWKTPSGSSPPSSNYDNGYFELLLDNPVEGGNYSCRLNPSSPAAFCFHDDDPMMQEVKVSVDEVKARLTLIESQQSQLKTENADLTDKNADLTDQLQSLKTQHHKYITNMTDKNADLTDQLQSLKTQHHKDITYMTDKNADLTDQLQSLKTQHQKDITNMTDKNADLTDQLQSLKTQHHKDITNLTQQVHSLETQHLKDITNLTDKNAALLQHVHSLETQLDQHHRDNTNLTNVVHILQDKVSARVSFHASLSSGKQVNSGNPVIMDRVMNNEGGSYSNTTGQFTVPRNGTYGFFASVGTYSTNNKATTLCIMMDDTPVCKTISYLTGEDRGYVYYIHSQGSSCHAVLHLVQGQRVWLKPIIKSDYGSETTVFSGFLLSAD